jgi:hypothetical protein
MEANGFGVDSLELSRMKIALQFKSAVLEMRAYQLAGKQFNISSPIDVSNVRVKIFVYIELLRLMIFLYFFFIIDPVSAHWSKTTPRYNRNSKRCTD